MLILKSKLKVPDKKKFYWENQNFLVIHVSTWKHLIGLTLLSVRENELTWLCLHVFRHADLQGRPERKSDLKKCKSCNHGTVKYFGVMWLNLMTIVYWMILKSKVKSQQTMRSCNTKIWDTWDFLILCKGLLWQSCTCVFYNIFWHIWQVIRWTSTTPNPVCIQWV